MESKGTAVQKASEESSGGFGGFGTASNKPSSAGKPSGTSLATGNSSSDPAFNANRNNILDGLKPIWLNKSSMSKSMQEQTKAKEIK